MTAVNVLRVVSGPEAGTGFALDDDGTVRIGRDDAQCAGVLTDPKVSRLHARVWDDRGILMIADEGSSVGTQLNGWSIDRPMPLRRGDVLVIGETELLVEWVPTPPDRPALVLPDGVQSDTEQSAQPEPATAAEPAEPTQTPEPEAQPEPEAVSAVAPADYQDPFAGHVAAPAATAEEESPAPAAWDPPADTSASAPAAAHTDAPHGDPSATPDQAAPEPAPAPAPQGGSGWAPPSGPAVGSEGYEETQQPEQQQPVQQQPPAQQLPASGYAPPSVQSEEGGWPAPGEQPQHAQPPQAQPQQTPPPAAKPKSDDGKGWFRLKK